MKKYSLNEYGVIGGRENKSNIYVKNLLLETNHKDEKLHFHPDSDEYYVVLDGNILFETKYEKINIKSGEIICFTKNELHQILEVKVPSKVLIIKTTNSTKD